MHFFFDNKTTFAGKIFMNRTDNNENFFNLTFGEDLEFMEVEKNQMYIREQDPTYTDLIETPAIYNESLYELFRSQSATVKMYESEPQQISAEYMPPIVLDSRPVTTEYIGRKSVITILGYKILFVNVVQRRMEMQADSERKYPR